MVYTVVKVVANGVVFGLGVAALVMIGRMIASAARDARRERASRPEFPVARVAR